MRQPSVPYRSFSRLLPALALLTLGLALLAAGCGGEDEPVRSLGPGPHPEQLVFDYRLVESRDGVREWVLDSEEMRKFAGDATVYLADVHMQFYRDGGLFSTLTADSGQAHTGTKDLFVWGDVIVVTTDGRRLETEELYYDNDRDLIHNEVFDRLTRGEDVVTGIGLEATPDLEYIEIKQSVQAEVGDDAAAEGERR